MTKPIEITDATAFEGNTTTTTFHAMHTCPKSKRVYTRNPDIDATRQLFEKAPEIPHAITEPPKDDWST